MQPLVSDEDIKSALQRRGPDSLGARIIDLYSEVSYDELKDFIVQSFAQEEGVAENVCGSEFRGQLLLIGATLQLRGVNPVVQPLTDEFGNVLVYNGIVYFRSFSYLVLCFFKIFSGIFELSFYLFECDCTTFD